MGTQMSIHYIAAFIVSLFLLLPLLGIATSGVNESREELESPANLSDTHTSSSMNEPGFYAGSIFTNSTIALGNGHACLITDDQVLRCWGENHKGQLGDGTQTDRNSIENASLPFSHLPTMSVDVASDSTCAVLVNGSLYCWGYNNKGQVGDGTKTDRHIPTLVDVGLGRTVITLSAGRDHICAILDDASVKCWGNNADGQLGLGYSNSSDNPSASGISTPQQVNLGNVTVNGIAAASMHTCAWLDNGSVRCWGGNMYGQVGDGTTWERDSPVDADLGDGNIAVAMATPYASSCALLQDGTIRCWGSGSSGVLGNSQVVASSVNSQLVSLPPGRTAIAIATGAISQHVCAILDNNSVYCWGDNYWGQVGDGTNTVRRAPVYVDIGGSGVVRALAIGMGMSCAVLDDASLKCWGDIYQRTDDPSNNPISMPLPNGQHIHLSERDIDGDGILNIFDNLMLGDEVDNDDNSSNDGNETIDIDDDGIDNNTDDDDDGIDNNTDDDDDGIANNSNTNGNEFWLIGGIIIVAMFLHSRNLSSRINELEKIITDSTIIEDDELSDN